jgi:hypothetical protein
VREGRALAAGCARAGLGAAEAAPREARAVHVQLQQCTCSLARGGGAERGAGWHARGAFCGEEAEGKGTRPGTDKRLPDGVCVQGMAALAAVPAMQDGMAEVPPRPAHPRCAAARAQPPLLHGDLLPRDFVRRPARAHTPLRAPARAHVRTHVDTCAHARAHARARAQLDDVLVVRGAGFDGAALLGCLRHADYAAHVLEAARVSPHRSRRALTDAGPSLMSPSHH